MAAGYYVLWDYPKELKTDEPYSYGITTNGDDVTDITYSFGWKFTCDGVTTEETVVSGLTIPSGSTKTTYTWTPTSVIFGPLMSKSKSGILNVVVKTSTGDMKYTSRDIPLTISDSVRPSITTCAIERTAYAFNDQSVSNMTTHRLKVGVAGVYGASQMVVATIGDSVNTLQVEAQTGTQISYVTLDLGSFDAGTTDSIEKTVRVTVTDARGFSVNNTASVIVYKYTPPTLEAYVYRDENEEAYINFTTGIQNTVAGSTNSISTFYARSTLGTTVTQTDLKTSPQKLNGADGIENSYNVFVLLMDAVGGKAIKRLVLPSNVPVIDIGADGKTVTFFGTSPTSSDVESVSICDSMHIYPNSIEFDIGRVVFDNGVGVITLPGTFRIDSDGINIFNMMSITPYTMMIKGSSGGCLSLYDDTILLQSPRGYADIRMNVYVTNDGVNVLDKSYIQCGGFTINSDGVLQSADCIYTRSYNVQIGDPDGNLGVVMARDGEGGTIYIYCLDSTKYWFMDTYNDNFRLWHYTGSTYPAQLTFDTGGNLLLTGGSIKHYSASGHPGVSIESDDEGGLIRIYDIAYDACWFMDSINQTSFRIGYVSNNSVQTAFMFDTFGYITAPHLESNDEVLAKRFGATGVNYNESCNALYCEWADGVNHNLVTRYSNGLGCAVGWVGTSSYPTTITIRGQTVKYDASGATSSSDERLKEDFQSLDNWESFFDNLEPCAFKLKNGHSGRYHLGFKAQQVKESLEKAGLTTQDFAGFVTTKYVVDEEDVETIELYEKLGIKPGDDVHGLIYTEFIALQHNEIQKLKARVKNLETEINNLKNT